MLDEIEMLRVKLNEMLEAEDAVLHSGEILKLSQTLDKFIFINQKIMIKRTQSNYKKQLQSFLCPTLYAKVVACLFIYTYPISLNFPFNNI